MAIITFNIPDAQIARVVNDVCNYFGYQATLPDGNTNPETPAQFAKRMIAKQIQQLCLFYEMQASQNNIQSDISINIPIT